MSLNGRLSGHSLALSLSVYSATVLAVLAAGLAFAAAPRASNPIIETLYDHNGWVAQHVVNTDGKGYSSCVISYRQPRDDIPSFPDTYFSFRSSYFADGQTNTVTLGSPFVQPDISYEAVLQTVADNPLSLTHIRQDLALVGKEGPYLGVNYAEARVDDFTASMLWAGLADNIYVTIYSRRAGGGFFFRSRYGSDERAAGESAARCDSIYLEGTFNRKPRAREGLPRLPQG